MRRIAIVASGVVLLLSGVASAGDGAAQACEESAAEVAGTQGAVGSLQGELDDLKKQRADLRLKMKELGALEQAKKKEWSKARVTLKKAQRVQKKACRAQMECARYGEKLEQLKGKINPVQNELGETLVALDPLQAKSDGYKEEVTGLDAKYTKLKCRAMRAGNVDAESLPICHQTYNRWSELKEELTVLTMDVRRLMRAHKRTMGRHKRLEGELDYLDTRTGKYCQSGPVVDDVKTLREQMDTFEPVGKKLSTLDRAVVKTRKIKLKEPRVPANYKVQEDEKPVPREKTETKEEEKPIKAKTTFE